MYAPVTSAGRWYAGVKAFVIYLLMSVYVANLANVFTNGAPVQQLISSIDDFVATGLPLCARNNAGQLSWMLEARIFSIMSRF